MWQDIPAAAAAGSEQLARHWGGDRGSAASERRSSAAAALLQGGIAQIALIVPDLDRAVRAYWDLFRIGPWHLYTYERPMLREMSYHGAPTDYAMRLALSWVGSLRIELIQPLRGETVYADFVREHGYGLHHVGVLVSDIKAALEQAWSAGLTMTQDGSGFGLDGDGHFAYLDTEDVIGMTIELIQRLPLGQRARRRPPELVYPSPEELPPDAQQNADAEKL